MEHRANWVDCAKGVGIILVVYGHVARGIVNAGIPVDVDLFKFIDHVIYSFHMPLFFFISGLFFQSSFKKRGAVDFLANKVDTIVYPYIIWSLLQGFTEVVLSKYTNGYVTVTEVLSLLWAPRAQFWFLYALFEVFFLVTVGYVIFRKNQLISTFVVLSLLYTVDFFIPGYIPMGIVGHVLFFVTGIFFYQGHKFFLKNKTVFLIISAIAFVAFQYILSIYMALEYVPTEQLKLLLALVSIFFVVFFSMSLSGWGGSWLSYLGNYSMPIYLMHILAASAARISLKNILGVTFLPLHLIFGTLIGLGIPIVAMWIINRFKLEFVIFAPRSLSISKRITKLVM